VGLGSSVTLMLRGATHPQDHSPILAGALIACLAVLGGIVPGVPSPIQLPPGAIHSLARPGSSVPSIIEILEQGFPHCRVVRADLIGGGGNQLNAVRTAYPKSSIVVPGDISELPRDVLVCPR
jgi:hypothetical protein